MLIGPHSHYTGEIGLLRYKAVIYISPIYIFAGSLINLLRTDVCIGVAHSIVLSSIIRHVEVVTIPAASTDTFAIRGDWSIERIDGTTTIVTISSITAITVDVDKASAITVDTGNIVAVTSSITVTSSIVAVTSIITVTVTVDSSIAIIVDTSSIVAVTVDTSSIVAVTISTVTRRIVATDSSIAIVAVTSSTVAVTSSTVTSSTVVVTSSVVSGSIVVVSAVAIVTFITYHRVIGIRIHATVLLNWTPQRSQRRSSRQSHRQILNFPFRPVLGILYQNLLGGVLGDVW